MMKRTLLTLLSVFLFNHVSAQILDIETERLKKDISDSLVAKFATNFKYNRFKGTDQNFVDILSISSGGYGDILVDRFSLILAINYNLIKNNNESIVNTDQEHLRVGYILNPNLHVETFAQHQSDAPRGIDQRLLGGAGLRFANLFSKRLNLGISGMYETESWFYNPTDSTEITIETSMPKVSTYIGAEVNLWKNKLSTVRLHLVGYYQSGPDLNNDVYRHRITNVSSLSYYFKNWLDLSLAFNFRYEKNPVIPKSEIGYLINPSVGISF